MQDLVTQIAEAAGTYREKLNRTGLPADMVDLLVEDFVLGVHQTALTPQPLNGLAELLGTLAPKA